jgi:hypothetical protein
MDEFDRLFRHVPHPRTVARSEGRVGPPPTVDDQREGLNGKLGLMITTGVGTMWAAYAFGLLSLVSLPTALRSGSSLIIVGWTAQTFLQLVLLPVIIVGQNIQARASDRRAKETFRDAEAILHEAMQLQEHLSAQDREWQTAVVELKALLSATQPGRASQAKD